MAPFGSAANSRDKKGSRKQTSAPKNSKISQNVKAVTRGAKEQYATPIWLQQAILDVFSNSFGAQDANELRERIQKVKGCLYNRDFIGAFESLENQEAYCLRWSPSRAIAYTELLCGVPEVFDFLKQYVGSDSEDIASEVSGTQRRSDKIACIGGGAGAEAVAFSAAITHAAKDLAERDENIIKRKPALLNAIDIADWAGVIDKLSVGIRSTFAKEEDNEQSQASTEVNFSDSRSSKSKNRSPLPLITFHHTDILTLPPSSLAPLITSSSCASSSTLITILFTLNELYSTSMSATTSFLLSLTPLTAPGTLLLVVDSPGSYSTVKLGETEKKYPMQWMLDHTLLKQAARIGVDDGEKDVEKWEKVGAEESRWWRMERGRLKYKVAGVELEDMRMQWHLFRRL